MSKNQIAANVGHQLSSYPSSYKSLVTTYYIVNLYVTVIRYSVLLVRKCSRPLPYRMRSDDLGVLDGRSYEFATL